MLRIVPARIEGINMQSGLHIAGRSPARIAQKAVGEVERSVGERWEICQRRSVPCPLLSRNMGIPCVMVEGEGRAIVASAGLGLGRGRQKQHLCAASMSEGPHCGDNWLSLPATC